ncbi:MAG: orotate phosphoribosyltransferase [Bacteroidetes bacterium CG23_combo_of_CG06-09_8_20_14_all_32_9]|nr:MAG: orotate phosphoribosyltransferase [Bacteroidetes bacterium CG23_combo_of_CG06-09_8_20_14_all_32_9]
MENINRKTAEYLLQIKAIKLSPSNPFTWASGLKSPIYCDSRKTLSYPEVRNYIRNSFIEVIKKEFGDADVIAGVATGAIAQGALVAQELNKPFVYIRSEPKKHGLENLIEGVVEKGQTVIVIEDLISTGGSSLKAVKALRDAECKVIGIAAIFTYSFPAIENNFAEAGCRLVTLSNYNVLITAAVKGGYISENDVETLKQWRIDPGNWNK